MDANVALDIAKLRQGSVDLHRVPHLLELARLARESETALQWDLGVAELAYDVDTHSISRERTQRLAEAIRQGLNKVESGSGWPKKTRCLIDGLGAKEVATYLPVVDNLYTHLLKIELLAAAGLSRHQAATSLRLYADWANSHLRNISAHAFQLACNVFGGDPAAARVLRIGSSKPITARARNAAWDLTPAFAMHYKTSRKVGRKRKQTILVTRDGGLSYLASSCIVAAFVRDSPLGDMTLARFGLDQPHFSGQLPALKEILQPVFAQQKRPVDRGDSASPRHVRKILREIEASLPR